jgi:FkbM family methyltransferase
VNTVVTDPILDIQKRWLDLLRLPPGPVVVDVGANTGRFTEEVLERWPDADVTCFEPNPQASALIAADAEVRPVGLGDKEGMCHLFTGAGPDMTASLYHRFDWPDDGFLVRIERLDRQSFDHIDLLKIDAEGHELAVLRGAGHMLDLPTIGCIQWEWNSCQLDAGNTYAQYLEVLRNYRVYEIEDGGTLREILDDDLDYETHRELVAL